MKSGLRLFGNLRAGPIINREMEMKSAVRLAHGSDNFRVSDIVNNYFGHFRKVPAIPFLRTHKIVNN